MTEARRTVTKAAPKGQKPEHKVIKESSYERMMPIATKEGKSQPRRPRASDIPNRTRKVAMKAQPSSFIPFFPRSGADEQRAAHRHGHRRRREEPERGPGRRGAAQGRGDQAGTDEKRQPYREKPGIEGPRSRDYPAQALARLLFPRRQSSDRARGGRRVEHEALRRGPLARLVRRLLLYRNHWSPRLLILREGRFHGFSPWFSVFPRAGAISMTTR